MTATQAYAHMKAADTWQQLKALTESKATQTQLAAKS